MKNGMCCVSGVMYCEFGVSGCFEYYWDVGGELFGKVGFVYDVGMDMCWVGLCCDVNGFVVLGR